MALVQEARPGRRRIAVVGAGVSGLTAAYILRHAADVTVYEADGRLGGHAHTHRVEAGSRTHTVDSGFIVYNTRAYPRLVRLFDELGVAGRDTEMSMSVHCEGCGLTYAGSKGPRGVFARPRSVVDRRFLTLLAEIPVFHRRARWLLAADETAREPSFGDFLAAGRFSSYFVRHFAVPLVSAVWSCEPGRAAVYPARYLFEFLAHHGILRIGRSTQWRTVAGGSQSYVRAVEDRLADVRVSTPVRSVSRFSNGVTVRDWSDGVAEYDAVVIATHADQALRLLSEPSESHRSVLGAFPYTRSDVLLHSDTSVLPRRPAARASWNYLLSACRPQDCPPRVSYDMNRLQGLDPAAPFVVTLNDNGRVSPDLVSAKMVYEHPVYTSASRTAQKRLPLLNDGVVAFAGAYHGWGFHEDGCRSGVEAARSLGVRW
jgi:predicted NAD/FAD-binding protein